MESQKQRHPQAMRFPWRCLGVAVVLFLLPKAISLRAQESEAVFIGVPTVKISEGGTDRAVEKLARDKGLNLKCVVSRIGETYYWASRDNVRLVRVESGIFVTFIAVNGSGYVRLIELGKDKEGPQHRVTEESFAYVEHLLLGLGSLTYYGNRER
jgi:hypothetical protein